MCEDRMARFLAEFPADVAAHRLARTHLAPGGAYHVHQSLPVVVLRQFPTLTFDPGMFVEVSMEPVHENPIPWDTLRALLGRFDRAGDVNLFMYMGTTVKAGVAPTGPELLDVAGFKHIYSRRYINVSRNGFTWNYEPPHSRYVRLAEDLAVRWAFS